MDDKLKQLMKEELETSLIPITTSTPTIHVGVPMSQIRSQLGLVTHPTLISQNLRW